MDPAKPILSVRGLEKTYATGKRALHPIDLEIARGELFALLGPNGAGKTTLIGLLCGIVRKSGGTATACGFDVTEHPREARQRVGLVPQELSTDMFETVWDTVNFSRGLFGKRPDPSFIEKLLSELSLWDKRDQKILTLSGGMKRRVLIAKALSHEPEVLFLDEPTAGVDVELRRDMWTLVGKLKERGVTIILTTHYIEEAEAMADRVGIISQGRLILVEDKSRLMKRLGKKTVQVELKEALSELPELALSGTLKLSENGRLLSYTFDTSESEGGTRELLDQLARLGLDFLDVETRKSSLEEIFVGLLGGAS